MRKFSVICSHMKDNTFTVKKIHKSIAFELILLYNFQIICGDITKLDKEKNQCIRQKTGTQNIVQEIKQYQEKWLKHVQKMDTNRLPNKH